MQVREILGMWRVTANGYPATMQFWQAGSALTGQIRFDNSATSENLTVLSFAHDPENATPIFDRLTFTRPGINQQYTGRVSMAGWSMPRRRRTAVDAK